jgi:hypothetical protein
MVRKIIFSLLALVLVFVALLYINPGGIFNMTLARILGEYKSPEFESNESIVQFARKHGVYYDRLYRVASMESFGSLQKGKLISIPTIFIFDQDKKLLSSASGKDCDNAMAGFFKRGDFSKMSVVDTNLFDILLKELEIIDQNNDPVEVEYYLFTGWAKFIPDNTLKLFDDIKDIKALGKNIAFYNINFDFRPEWESQMDSLGLLE